MDYFASYSKLFYRWTDLLNKVFFILTVSVSPYCFHPLVSDIPTGSISKKHYKWPLTIIHIKALFSS